MAVPIYILLGNALEIGTYGGDGRVGGGSGRGQEEKLSCDPCLGTALVVPQGALELGWPASDAMS